MIGSHWNFTDTQYCHYNDTTRLNSEGRHNWWSPTWYDSHCDWCVNFANVLCAVLLVIVRHSNDMRSAQISSTCCHKIKKLKDSRWLGNDQQNINLNAVTESVDRSRQEMLSQCIEVSFRHWSEHSSHISSWNACAHDYRSNPSTISKLEAANSITTFNWTFMPLALILIIFEWFLVSNKSFQFKNSTLESAYSLSTCR